MKVLVYMGHPAHYWYLTNVVRNLKKDGHEVVVLIKKKEMLETLLKNAEIPYMNILEEGRKDSTIGMAWGTIKRLCRAYKVVHKNHFDLLIGTSVENSFVGPLCGVPAVYCGEDDYDIAPIEGGLSYPGAKNIMTPISCNNGKWDKSGKVINYPSYHELAYLHPNHFIPNKKVVEQYGIDTTKPYFIIRFVKLTANHDVGVQGISTEVAQHIIDLLSPHGQIYITSERELEPQFEQYRLHINPLDIHHVMAFATLYLGDSQSMAVEAAMLGVPSLRFNDFVEKKKIGVMEELEHVYGLTYGISSHEPERLYAKIQELLAMPNLREEFQARREKMLADKIDVTAFFTYFIENYPQSAKEAKENKDNQDFWKRFR